MGVLDDVTRPLIFKGENKNVVLSELTAHTLFQAKSRSNSQGVLNFKILAFRTKGLYLQS